MKSSVPNQGLQAYYAAKRQRTIDLVRKAVDTLLMQQRQVTIAAICALSCTLDAAGKGIHPAGVLGNTEAYAYYCQHSVTHTAYKKRRTRKAVVVSKTVNPYHLHGDRDPQRARTKYLHAPRAVLIERLLSVEQALAETHQQLVRVQFALAETQAH